MRNPDVIVIGAGLSGLSAACLLADMGHEVLVLERSKEPGGRARTIASSSPGLGRHESRPDDEQGLSSRTGQESRLSRRGPTDRTPPRLTAPWRTGPASARRTSRRG